VTRRSRRWPVSGLAVASLLFGSQGCQAGPDDQPPVGARFGSPIRVLADNSASLGIPRVTRSPVVVAWVMVCLDGDRPQRIEDVRAVGAKHVRVTDFALRDNPAWPGGDTWTGGDVELDWHVDLDEAGFDRDDKTVTLPCDDPGGASHQLGIELQRTGPQPGVVKSFEVVWRGGSAPMPFTVLLCPLARAWHCKDARE
jgi:hypothetical protein